MPASPFRIAVLLAFVVCVGSPARAEVQLASYEPRADAELRGLWAEGVALEAREELIASSAFYVTLAERLPRSAFVRWRLSRNYWRFGERLPTDDKETRLHYFGLAETWADRSLEIDPECGECVMWKLSSLGRIATTTGVVRAARTAPKIAELIDYGISLQPTYRDSDDNTTLGNLYYAGSAFYRVVPDWFWLQWVIGVRGDKERSLEYIRKALEITESRIDYRVELGAVLLCIGHEEGDEEKLTEGRDVLDGAMELSHFQSTDAIDVEHARIMHDSPKMACGYSRDGWIDLKEAAHQERGDSS